MARYPTGQQGLLDKFIDGAIKVASGIPVNRENDENRAVRATIGMNTDLWEWNDEHDKHCIEMDLGLNSNSVVSGNTGSYKRMCYTIINGGVNLVAWLEPAYKQYLACSDQRAHPQKAEEQLLLTRSWQSHRPGQDGTGRRVRDFEFHGNTTFLKIMVGLSCFKDALEKYGVPDWSGRIKSSKER